MLEVEAFDEEGVCAEAIGAINGVHLGRTSENYDRQSTEAVVLSNPGEDGETIFAGEFEVQEDEDRKRELHTVGKLSFAGEVGDDVVAGANELDGVLDGGLFKGASHQEDVVLAVFNDKNYVVIWHTNNPPPRACECNPKG